jgi:hypothetical protein
MAISAPVPGGHHVGMQAATNPAATRAARHLKVVPVRRPDAVDRNAALRQVRRARTQLEGREQRFAHLKRMYD